MEKKRLNYNEGKDFISTLKFSASNHGIEGSLGIVRYIFKRVTNNLYHIAAQFVPVNKLRVVLHKLRGVQISKNVRIGANVWIDEAYPEYVTLESYSALAIGCKVLAHSIPPKYHKDRFESYVAPVYIKKGVWVGAYSIILAGVTIGEGSVISTGSVVTQDIPPFSIARGNPAKVITKLK